MTRRTGELAGHLWSDDPGFRRLMLRATQQTARLAERGITYMVVPLEARRAMAAEVQSMSDREWRRHYLPVDRAAFAGLCMATQVDPEAEVELTCLLPADHLPGTWHGYVRFLDAAERGRLEAEAAAARVQDRFDAALEEAKRRINTVALEHLRQALEHYDPLENLRRAHAELDLEAGAEDD